MKSKLYFLASGIVVLCLAFGLVMVKRTAAQGNPHRVIVTFEEWVVNEAAEEAIKNSGGIIIKPLPLVNGMVAILPNRAAERALEGRVGVTRIEKDAEVFILKPPGACDPWPACKGGDEAPPPNQTLEWGIDRIDAELAWSTSQGTGVKVAVIDTGIDQDHPDLINNLVGGVNFVSKPWWKPADPNNWDDDNGHGSHVAGIIAAVDNTIGVVGVAPQAKLYAVKVLDRNGSGYVSDVIDGITWAVMENMQVINMSLGTATNVQALHDAVDAAYEAGLALVAAAGNNGDGNALTNEVVYPAKYASVIAAGATAQDDSSPSWSAEGTEVELAAPGVEIRSTWNNGDYRTISGTSMASPHVAGTIALLLSMPVGSWDVDSDGFWDPVEVRVNLQTVSDDLGPAGFDNFYGYGLVDAEEAATGVQTSN